MVSFVDGIRNLRCFRALFALERLLICDFIKNGIVVHNLQKNTK
jgi:hypothetical protein